MEEQIDASSQEELLRKEYQEQLLAMNGTDYSLCLELMQAFYDQLNKEEKIVRTR